MPGLLGDDILHRIEASRSLPEAVQILSGTGFDMVPRVYGKTGDIKSAEMAMFARQVEEERLILKFLPKHALPFFTEWTRRLEVESLKAAFRLWFDHHIRKRSISAQAVYLYREPVIEKIDYDRLLALDDDGAILELVKKTPWKDLLAEQLPIVRERESVFLLEVSLDRFHYHRLLQASRKLLPGDKKTADRLLQTLADEQNLLLAFRLKNFGAEGKDLFLEGGIKVTRTLFNRLVTLEEKDFLAETIRLYPALARNSKGEASLDDLFAWFTSQREHKGRKLISGTPFTIGTPLAYSLIKTLETERLRSLLNARYYRAGEDR
jgi:V/A-type H+-transporting ATPase subunit C